MFAYIGRLSREGIAAYSAYLAVILAILLLASWFYLELGFTIDLLIWFFFFFCAFHSWAAGTNHLTQTAARKIDYWYLSAAAIAALAASATLPIQRSEYELRIPIPTLNEKEIAHHVQDLVHWVCFAGLKPEMAEKCGGAQTLDARLALPMTEKDYAIAADNFQKQMQEEYTPQERDSDVERNFYQTELQVLDDLKFAASYFRRVREREKQLESKGRYPAFTEFWYLTGQTFLWPFAFAVALALRITKTTIEVFGWADKFGGLMLVAQLPHRRARPTGAWLWQSNAPRMGEAGWCGSQHQPSDRRD
jgi:hypothetical protein